MVRSLQYVVLSKKKKKNKLWIDAENWNFLSITPLNECFGARILIEGAEWKGWLTQITSTNVFLDLPWQHWVMRRALLLRAFEACVWDFGGRLNTAEVKGIWFALLTALKMASLRIIHRARHQHTVSHHKQQSELSVWQTSAAAKREGWFTIPMKQTFSVTKLRTTFSPFDN